MVQTHGELRNRDTLILEWQEEPGGMPVSQKEERGKCCGWRSILTFYGHYQSMSHSQFLVIQTSFSGLAWLIEWNPDEIRTVSLPMAACIDVSTSDILSTTAFYSLVSVITFTHNISNWFHHWITSQKRTIYFEWTIYISIPLVQVVITFPFLKRVLVSQKINGFNFDNFNHIYHIYLTYICIHVCVYLYTNTHICIPCSSPSTIRLTWSFIPLCMPK